MVEIGQFPETLCQFMALALAILALVAMPAAAAMKFSVRRPDHVGPEKIPTYPCQADDQMGWSYGLDEGARERNFVPQGNFALYPSYHIPSKTEQSFMFKIMFHVSGREKEVCIEALKMYTLASVLAAITRQHPMEVVAAPHLHPDDFTHIMKETLQPFYNLLRERRGEWGEDLQKIPVICIGPQPHILPDDPRELDESHFEYYFHKAEGPVGHNGERLANSKTSYHEGTLGSIEELFYVETGKDGFFKYLSAPLVSTESALAFFESVVCGPMIGAWAFHGVIVKHLLRQQPIIVICGEPGGGKTKEASTALALSSRLSNLFANQV